MPRAAAPPADEAGAAARRLRRRRAALEARARRGRPLAWFRPGRTVEAPDPMRARPRRYAYVLAARPGRGFAPGFRPQLSPARMLRMGVFEGRYLNDCTAEFPREWFLGALPRLCPGAADPRVNAFGVKSRLSLREWRRKGWAPAFPGDPDVRGWFQWYCRYWLGRRDPRLDPRQIRRWRAFARHRAQVVASLRRLAPAARPRTRAAKRAHRPRQRQALLQWAYDPYV